jgi:hypothetical protein
MRNRASGNEAIKTETRRLQRRVLHCRFRLRPSLAGWKSQQALFRGGNVSRMHAPLAWASAHQFVMSAVPESGRTNGHAAISAGAFSSEVDTGSREENASKQESRASVLIQSEPIML